MCHLFKQPMLFINFFYRHNFTHFILAVVNVQFLRQINQTLQLIFATWHIYQYWVDLKPSLYTINCRLNLAANSIHLVNQSDPWYFELICLLPYRFALCLNSHHSVENSDRAITDPQRTFYFSVEIYMAWSVY